LRTFQDGAILRDYYEILGLAPDASLDEVKSAYRRLAHRYHPDKNPDDPEAGRRFQQAREAYSVLSDPADRADYDRRRNSEPVGSAPTAERAAGTGLGDLVGDLLSRRRPRPEPGEDLRYTLELDLEKAARGADEEIRLPRLAECPECGGSGARPGSTPLPCSACEGQGTHRVRQGMLTFPKPCPVCEGRGILIRDRCPCCSGEGRIRVEEPLRIHVPAGVEDGQHLRLAGEGGPGQAGGPPGDLFVVIAIREHPQFSRSGEHLEHQATISMARAALGGSITVPTLEGTAELTIPPGTQSGACFRLVGRGLAPGPGGEPGDLLIRVHVETPVGLDPSQRELLEAFERSRGEDES